MTARKAPSTQQPWDECHNSAISNKFWVKDGFTAVVKTHILPDNACMSFQECIFQCCCTREINVPVREACGCNLAVDCVGEVELSPGEYRLVLETCDGEPLVPDPSDILVTVHHKFGSC